MIIDDDPLISRMYQKRLSDDGHRALTAENGSDGFVIAKREHPDLILLDLMMPKLNGVETLKLLKNNSETKDIKVIILTNLENTSDEIEKAKAMGALNYWIKASLPLKTLSENVRVTLEVAQ